MKHLIAIRKGKLQRQLVEMAKCQGRQTKEYVDSQISNLTEVNGMSLLEIKKHIETINNLMQEDDLSFDLIKGIVEGNKENIARVQSELDRLTKEIQELEAEFSNKIQVLRHETEATIRVNSNRINDLERDMEIDLGELCDAFALGLGDTERYSKIVKL